jgi:hypothetical protein
MRAAAAGFYAAANVTRSLLSFCTAGVQTHVVVTSDCSARSSSARFASGARWQPAAPARPLSSSSMRALASCHACSERG